MRQICKTTERVERYGRLDPRLDVRSDGSKTNIHALKLQAERLIDERGDDLERFRAVLTAHA